MTGFDIDRLDRRLNAFRPDLADMRLEGVVEAERFVEGRAAMVTVAVADLRNAPRADAGLDTQLLAGEEVRIFEERGGFAWVQAVRDSYVGYVAAADLGMPAKATHRVIVPRTFTYSGPDLKLPMRHALSLGAAVHASGTATTRGTDYLLLDNGEAMVAQHLAVPDIEASDYVAVAETLIHTPYLWGGTSAFGIDCSGLVQLSMRMAGRSAPRDTDMQAAAIGRPIEPGIGSETLRRGDLVFWKGHVAIMLDGADVVHANGATMTVAREPLKAAVERIAPLYGTPTGFRRP